MWQRDTNQDVCHWSVRPGELKLLDLWVSGTNGRKRPGKKFPAIGNRGSLGGLKGLFLMREGFKCIPHRSSPPPVFDRFFAVEPKLQAEMRSVGLQ